MIWVYISKIFRFLDPELSHNIAIFLLKLNFYPRPKVTNVLVKIDKMMLKNPIGLAAGFDKNGEIIKPISNLGFGFTEIGTITPNYQYGNKKPRVFRLSGDRGIINRNGFNNDGMVKVKQRLIKYRNVYNTQSNFKVGLNFGVNKNSPNRIYDYELLASNLSSYADFISINVSSPNTPGLRSFQSEKSLTDVINSVYKGLKNEKAKKIDIPVFIKISPDLKIQDLENIINVAIKKNVTGLIISNTTVDRDLSLKTIHKKESGGLSGRPLFKKSTEILLKANKIVKKYNAKLYFIAVGGIEDSISAYIKILCGAHLLQLYTSLTFEGPFIVKNILNGLQGLMERDKLKNLDKVRGVAKTFAEAERIASTGLK